MVLCNLLVGNGSPLYLDEKMTTKSQAHELLTAFTADCERAEGDTSETGYMWTLTDCREHMQFTINSYKDKYAVNELITDFLDWCLTKQTEEHLLDTTEIADLVPEYIEKFGAKAMIKDVQKDLLLSTGNTPFLASFKRSDAELGEVAHNLISRLAPSHKKALQDSNEKYWIKDMNKAWELILAKASPLSKLQDQWTNEQQQRFMFSLLAGNSETVIWLYDVVEVQSEKGHILYGLRELEAIARLFTDGDFLIPTKPLELCGQEDYVRAEIIVSDPRFERLTQNALIAIKHYPEKSEQELAEFFITLVGAKNCNSENCIKKAVEYYKLKVSEPVQAPVAQNRIKLISISTINGRKVLHKTSETFKDDGQYILVEDPVRVYFKLPNDVTTKENGVEVTHQKGEKCVAYLYNAEYESTVHNTKVILDYLASQLKERFGVEFTQDCYDWMSWDVCIHTDLIGYCS